MAEEGAGTPQGSTDGAAADDGKSAGSDGAGGGTNQDPPAGDGKAADGAADGAGTGDGSPKKDERVVPESYDLKLPEGSQLDEGAIESVSKFAKEKGLTNEEAQAILERDSAVKEAWVKGAEARLSEQSEAWIEETKKDPEIGGDKFNESAELAKRVISRFAPDALKDGLNKTGFGNHPGLVRMLVDIGRSMGEDKLVKPGSQTVPRKKSIQEHLYGGTSAKET